MRPPVLQVGFEFEQSQPTAYQLMTGVTTKKVQTYKMRTKLKARGAVNVNSKFNIDRLFYNEITFELDEVIAYYFGDIIFIYKDI